MKIIISACVVALFMVGCQKAAEPAPAPETAVGQPPAGSAADTLGTPPGLANVSITAAEAIADFRADSPVSNPDRPVNADEILERDVERRQMFYRAEQADPSIITPADRAAVAELETNLVEEICLNLPLSAETSGYETVTAEDCPPATN